MSSKDRATPHTLRALDPVDGVDPAAAPVPVRVRRPSLVPRVVLASDLTALLFASALARLWIDTAPSIAEFLFFPLLGMLLLAARGTYQKTARESIVDAIPPIIGSIGVAALVTLAVSRPADAAGVDVWLVAWLLASVFVIGERALIGLARRAAIGCRV